MVDSRSELSVVLLHHFGGAARTWDAVIARMPGVRCIALELRGFGGTVAPDGDYSFAAHVQDVRQALRARGIERCVLVGHSMGGKIALAVAAADPHGIEALVLLAPSPPSPEPMTDAARARLATALERHAGDEVVTGAIAGPLPAAVFATAVADVERSVPAAWQDWLVAGSRVDLVAAARDIRVPTVVLSGTADVNIPTAVVTREVVNVVPGAALVIVPDAGHLLPLEAPAAVAATLRTLVARRERAVLARATAAEPAREALLAASARYPVGAVAAALASDAVSAATRTALAEREATPVVTSPRALTEAELATLRAACARLVALDRGSPPVDLAGGIDARLARGVGNGWRFDVLPPDADSYRRLLAGLDDLARRTAGVAFVALDGAGQDALLATVQAGDARGDAWAGFDAVRAFEELLAEVSELYFSQPAVQDAIGYVGFADRPAWTEIRLDQREAREPPEVRPEVRPAGPLAARSEGRA